MGWHRGHCWGALRPTLPSPTLFTAGFSPRGFLCSTHAGNPPSLLPPSRLTLCVALEEVFSRVEETQHELGTRGAQV